MALAAAFRVWMDELSYLSRFLHLRPLLEAGTVIIAGYLASRKPLHCRQREYEYGLVAQIAL